MVNNPPSNAGDVGSAPDPERFPWRRKWQPTPVILPGKSHEQRSLAGYSPWGRKRAGRDLVTKQQTLHLYSQMEKQNVLSTSTIK